MSDASLTNELFPHLSERDRRMADRAVRQLHSHGVIADFDGENADITELYTWTERNLPLIESYFRVAGLGIRAHSGFPVIQLVLEDDGGSHPLRRRLDKAETGLLICLWILYHEQSRETEGFIVAVTVEQVYARLATLFRTDKEIPEGIFCETIRFFERYYLVQTDWLTDDFERSRLGLLPTLLTTFRFNDPAEALASVLPSPTKSAK